jgi:hypothetical protein
MNKKLFIYHRNFMGNEKIYIYVEIKNILQEFASKLDSYIFIYLEIVVNLLQAI